MLLLISQGVSLTIRWLLAIVECSAPRLFIVDRGAARWHDRQHFTVVQTLRMRTEPTRQQVSQSVSQSASSKSARHPSG